MMRHKRKAENSIITERRMVVASLMTRAYSLSHIVAELAEKGFINPETGNPYALTTIFEDTKAIKKEWHENAQKSIQQWREEQLADIDELVRTAYINHEFPTIRGALELKIKLTGTAEAEKIDLSVQPTKTYVVVSPSDWPDKK